MKKLLFILVLLTYSNIFAVDYYYYQNQRIDLQQRADRIAVVLKNTTSSKNEIESSLKSRLSSDAKILETGFNTYEIKFSSYKLPTELMSVSNNFSNLDFVKFTTPVYYGESRSVIQVPTDEFIVRLRNEKDFEKLQMLNTENKIFISGNVFDNKGFLLKSYDDVTLNALDLSNIYYNTGLFEFCEPNFIYPEGGLLNYWPNDPFINSQWHLSNGGQTVRTGGSQTFDELSTTGVSDADMNVNLAWDITRGSANITVGVFDTGIDSAHPDLRTNVIAGYDAIWNRMGVPRDSNGHGTCTAGLIAARGDNGVGISGVAPLCKIQSFRVLNANGTGVLIALSRSFDSARVWGVEVLNNSWGGGTPNNTITLSINAAADSGRNGRGCAIFFSSGNDGRSYVSYPSSLPKVISVGATTNRDKRKAPGTGEQYWWGGNYGSNANGDIDVCAPTICLTTDIQGFGGYVQKAGVNGDYDSTFNGTSCSCPNVSGIAALLLSANSNLTRLQVYEYICRGSEKVDRVSYDNFKTYGWWNAYYGYGRVNAYYALKLAQGVDVVPPGIVYDPVRSTTNTQYTRIFATFYDQDGITPVPTEGPNQPYLFYRVKRADGGWGALYSLPADSVSLFGGRIFHMPGFGWNTQVKYFFIARDENGNASYYPKHCRVSATEGLLDAYYFAVGQQQTVTGRISNFNTAPAGGILSGGINLTNSQLPILDTRVRVYGSYNIAPFDIDDVHLQLVSPNMESYENRFSIFGRYPGNGSITGPTFYDGSNSYMASGNAPYTNANYRPDYPFESLNGTDANGLWKFIAYDQATEGNPTIGSMTYDSLRLTMTVLSTRTSPCFVHLEPKDTVIDFGNVAGGQIKEVTYYVKNNGTDTLNILGNPVISGGDAARFSILFAPTRVMPNDSNAFIVRCSHPLNRSTGGNEPEFDNPQRATLRFRTDSPDHDTVFVSLQTQNALPVELANFTANVNKKDVQLKWATVSELNNSGFDIERKENNDWKKVTFIQGNGTTNVQKEYSYTDRNLQSGKYDYRLKQIDYNGNFEYYELNNEVTVGIPQKYFLSQNYPNPFNPSTKIDYELPFDSQVKIRIYDMTGREVAALVNGMTAAGYYTAQFNASSMASGIYFCSIEAADNNLNNKFSKVIKMSLVK